MQHVPKRWLSILAYILVGLDVLVVAGYIGINHMAEDPGRYSQWGLTSLILVMSLVHAGYVLLIYPFLRKKLEWIAAVISNTFFLVIFAAIIETSEYHNLVYRIGYAVMIFASATAGPFTPMGAVILTWVFLLYTYFGTLMTPINNFSFRFEIAMDISVTVAGLLGWLFFKKYYLRNDTKEVAALSNLLQQEQLKSSVILESITDGVLVVNTQGTVQVLNQSAAQMFGWTKEEALKLDYRSLLKPVSEGSAGKGQQVPESVIGRTLQTSKAAQQVSLFQTHNQRRIFVDIIASPIFETRHNSEGEAEGKAEKNLVGVIAVLRDVDEQKRQEQQRSDFISTASHEMRTPVASIQGFIELALNPKVTTIDEKARSYLEKAHEATEHLGELFQDLLTVSKSDDGRLTNNPEVIEIGEFLKEIIEQDKVAAERKGLKVVVQMDNTQGKSVAPLMHVHADPERLREVINNLFDNAVKYTESGMITVGASLKEQGVVLRISDTGMGIAEEDIPHLFQKFYRTDNTATREIGGTGLGLYISRQIVEMMGGKIWVESTVGAGSTFYVEIPRVDPSAVNAAKPDQS